MTVRVPLSWLRDYVDIDLAPRELAELLTLRGMEVTTVEAGGAEWNDVVVGRLLEVAPHPNADALLLARVDVGRGEALEIVCGATNIAPGQLVPVALAGSVLPGGRRIERTKIRGVTSQGMLCSAAELGLGTDADGIHILGTNDEVPIGANLAEVLGEAVLDVDVKPNRGDALSMVGLAREIAAFTGARLRMPEVSVPEARTAATDHVTVEISAPDLCPRFTARYLTEVSNRASPDWMRRRLLAAGMRPVSTVVDVTNYVMHELGQPMHAYDADAIPDGRIVVRRARDGEELETIDHELRRLDARMLVIADAERPIGLAGIMGGASTEVGEETTRVIIESAIFHGPTIRNTARRLGLRSEASTRHEKGIAPNLPRLAADRAAQLLAELAGATVAAGIVDNDPEPRPLRTIEIDLSRMERLLGIGISAERLADLLRPLEFGVTVGDGRAIVTVPPHRPDVIEPADVAEEAARAHGYEAIPGRLPQPHLPPFRPDPSEPRHRVRRIMAGLGLDELVTHALVGPDDLARSGAEATADHLIRVANPLSVEHSILRPSMYPSLLRALAENVRQRRTSAWVFEVGKTYWYDPRASAAVRSGAESAGTDRYEAWHLGIALVGSATPPAPGARPREAEIADLKGIVEALHRALGAPLPGYRAETDEERHPHLHPGRAGRLLDPSGRAYGSIGELHPQVAEAWSIPGRPVIAAVNLGALLRLVPEEPRVTPVPAAQPIDRDLAVAVDEATPVGELLRIARLNAGPALAELRLFDVYRGPQIGAGKVSYALAFRFQPTTAGDERSVEKALNKVTGALRHHLGAEIRTT